MENYEKKKKKFKHFGKEREFETDDTIAGKVDDESSKEEDFSDNLESDDEGETKKTKGTGAQIEEEGTQGDQNPGLNEEGEEDGAEEDEEARKERKKALKEEKRRKKEEEKQATKKGKKEARKAEKGLENEQMTAGKDQKGKEEEMEEKPLVNEGEKDDNNIEELGIQGKNTLILMGEETIIVKNSDVEKLERVRKERERQAFERELERQKKEEIKENNKKELEKLQQNLLLKQQLKNKKSKKR